MAAVEAFDVVDLIHAKRDRGELSTAEINWLVDAYTRAYVGDEQMAAMLMAIFLNGMSRTEIRDLTMAMIASGGPMTRRVASSSSTMPTMAATMSSVVGSPGRVAISR